MSRDYAKKNLAKNPRPPLRGEPRKPVKVKKKSTGSNLKLVIFTFVVVVIFIIALYYLGQMPKSSKSKPPEKNPVKTVGTFKPAAQYPKFIFKNLQDKKLAAAPSADLSAANQAPQANAAQATATTGYYELLIGRFQALSEADQVRSNLLSQGFAAHITQKDGENAVTIGPFPNQAAAFAKQQKLLANGFASTLVHRDK